MLKHLLICSLLVFPTLPGLNAQSSTSRHLGLRAGIAALHRQDLVFSPFRHRGTGLVNIGLDYSRRKQTEHFWRLDFSMISADHAPSFEYVLPNQPGEIQVSAPHSFLFADLTYGILGKATSMGNTFLSWGGSANFEMNALNYNHARISNFGYLLSLDLALQGKAMWKPARRLSVEAGVRLPFLTWAARSPYLINDDEFIKNIAPHGALKMLWNFFADGAPESFGRYRKLDFELRLMRNIGHGGQAGLGYEIQVLSFSRPAPLRSLRQGLTLNFTVKL